MTKAKRRDELRAKAIHQNLRQYQESTALVGEAQELNFGVIRLGDRDPSTGREQVVYPNGGQALAGERTFNASLPALAPVRATKTVGSTVVAMDSRSATPSVEEELIPDPIPYPIKILFSVIEDGLQKFYVGGDRKVPTKILEIPESMYINDVGFNNTGPKKDDWVAGINYGMASDYTSTIVTLHGKNTKNWQLPSHKYNVLLKWKGYGFWSSPTLFPPTIDAGYYFLGSGLNGPYAPPQPTSEGASFEEAKQFMGAIGNYFTCTESYPDSSNASDYSDFGGATACKNYAANGPLSISRTSTTIFPITFDNSSAVNYYHYYDFTLTADCKEVRSYQGSISARVAPAMPDYPPSSCEPANVGEVKSGGSEILPKYSEGIHSIATINVSTQLVHFSAFEGSLQVNIGSSEQQYLDEAEFQSDYYCQTFYPIGVGTASSYHDVSSLDWSLSCTQFSSGTFFQTYPTKWIGNAAAHYTPGQQTNNILVSNKYTSVVNVSVAPGFMKTRRFHSGGNNSSSGQASGYNYNPITYHLLPSESHYTVDPLYQNDVNSIMVSSNAALYSYGEKAQAGYSDDPSIGGSTLYSTYADYMFGAAAAFSGYSNGDASAFQPMGKIINPAEKDSIAPYGANYLMVDGVEYSISPLDNKNKYLYVNTFDSTLYTKQLSLGQKAVYFQAYNPYKTFPNSETFEVSIYDIMPVANGVIPVLRPKIMKCKVQSLNLTQQQLDNYSVWGQSFYPIKKI